jgi:CubicO group peptidase (beta-lactamase class C family)
MLANQEDLSLNDPISMYLPERVSLPTFNNKSIELIHLATHTSGLPREPTNMNWTLGNQRYSTYTHEEMYEFLAGYSIQEPIGTRSVYSNGGYALLSHILERINGKSFEDQVIGRITSILDMSDTRIELNPSQRSRLIEGFKDGLPTEELDIGVWGAAGGFKSTANDLLSYLGANIGLTPSPLYESMQSAHHEIAPHYDTENASLSLTWEILNREESGETIYYFKGSVDGFVSFVGFNKETQIGVVMLNSGRRYFSDIAFNILDPTYPLLSPGINPAMSTR